MGKILTVQACKVIGRAIFHKRIGKAITFGQCRCDSLDRKSAFLSPVRKAFGYDMGKIGARHHALQDVYNRRFRHMAARLGFDLGGMR